LLGKTDDRFQTVPRKCDDVGTTERRGWDQLSKRITYGLGSTKTAKFQCRKCINVLWLQRLVTNREASLAVALFTGFSLCGDLQTLYLCSPNCSSGWTKRTTSLQWRSTTFRTSDSFWNRRLLVFCASVLVLLAIPISVSG